MKNTLLLSLEMTDLQQKRKKEHSLRTDGDKNVVGRGSGGNGATLRKNSIFIFPEHCLQRINAKSYRAINPEDNT
jgi:hypothetical protein